MAEVRRNDDMYMLMEDTQLQKLAKLLRNQEEPLMVHIKSEPDREKFLKECNDSYENVVTLLDLSIELRSKNEAARAVDHKKADIATNLQDYVKYGINMSLQCIQNCGLRLISVDKIREHFDDLAAELNMLDSTRDVHDVDSLAEEVSFYKQTMWEYTNKYRSASARALSKAYSDALKMEGISFPNLILRHKNRLKYKEEFEYLEDDEKLEVYNSIIRESGRAEIPTTYKRTRSGGVGGKVGGIAVLAMNASMMVWDIFTAEHKVEAVLESALSVLTDVGAFIVEVSVSAAVSTAVANMEMGIIAVSLAGFVAGAIAGLLFAAAAGAIIGLILGTSGKEVPNLDGLKFYSATMPNGMALANEISHD